MTEKVSRITLITGANRGLGRAVALSCADRGDHIVAVGRQVGGLEELDDEVQKRGSSATLVPLDVTDRDGINRLGQMIFERFGRIDGVFANAAILGPLSPLSDYPADKFANVMQVNLASIHDLYRSMHLLLKQSGRGRLVFMSSGVARHPRAYWGGYAISKAAIENYMAIAAMECAPFNIKVNAVDPGALRTRMRAQAMPGEDPLTLRTPETIAPSICKLLGDECHQHGEVVMLRD